jgi:hypothetical protein
LETAKEANATLPQLSVCMAQGPNVARRIELILHPRTERGSISKPCLLTAAFLLIGTSLPVAITAITRHESQQSIPQSAAPREPVPVLVDCCLLKPGVLFSETGLKVFAETKAARPGKKPDSNKDTSFIYSFPIDSSKELIEKWTKSGKLLSHPVVFTLNGQQATISTSAGPEDSQTLKFLPTINANGGLTMEFSYDFKQRGSTSYAESITYTSKLPGTIVISRNTGPKQPKEVLAIVTVKRANLY